MTHVALVPDSVTPWQETRITNATMGRSHAQPCASGDEDRQMELSDIIPTTAENPGDGLLVVERGGPSRTGYRVAWANAAAVRLFGSHRAGAATVTFSDLARAEKGDDAPRLSDLLSSGATGRKSLCIAGPDGDSVRLGVQCSPLSVDGDGRGLWLLHITGSEHASADSQMLRDALADAETRAARVAAAIDALPQAFAMYDSESRLVTCNQRYREIYECTGEIIAAGTSFETILRAGLEKGQYPEAAGREEAWLAERLERHRNPSCAFIQPLPGNRFVQVHEVRTAFGDLVGFRTDVTSLKAQQNRLRTQASVLKTTMQELHKVSRTDDLTGLLNRRGLESVSREAEEDSAIAVLHIDLDRFKPINDVFGHEAGDHLLREVAMILRAAVRDTDSVARVGGDEFAVVLVPDPEMRGELTEMAEVTADRIIECCMQPVLWQGHKLIFGASIGVACGRLSELKSVMRDADIALYKSKSEGQNRTSVFTPQLRRAARDRKALADEFVAGFAAGHVVAYYQPQVCARTGVTVGAEALVRWRHPDRGLIQPADFLPIVGELAMTAELDQRVLEHAVETARLCASAGRPLDRMSVNVSYRQIRSLGDLSFLHEIQPWPTRLAFELLEAIDFEADDGILEDTLKGVRDIGVEIELDDFGSGHTSLTTLLKLRPDRIKIDRKIVADALVPESGAMPMIRAIIEMARGLDTSITAEGVETADQAALMERLGCHTLQGFHFARPMSRTDLMEWLGAHDRDGLASRIA